jgi:hypothetical protein
VNPIERRIRSVPDGDIHNSVKEAFPGKSEREIIAELTRMIVFVAVCWNDVIEDGRDPFEVLDRYVFIECNELAECFPWPPE